MGRGKLVQQGREAALLEALVSAAKQEELSGSSPQSESPRGAYSGVARASVSRPTLSGGLGVQLGTASRGSIPNLNFKLRPPYAAAQELITPTLIGVRTARLFSIK